MELYGACTHLTKRRDGGKVDGVWNAEFADTFDAGLRHSAGFRKLDIQSTSTPYIDF